VFHDEAFLGRAVSADLAGETVPLREIIRACNRRRRELRAVLRDRQQAVDNQAGRNHGGAGRLDLSHGDRKCKSALPDQASSARPQAISQRIMRAGQGSSTPWSIAALPNFAMPAAATSISASAMGRPASAKRSRPSATAGRPNSEKLTLGAMTLQCRLRSTLSSIRPSWSIHRAGSKMISAVRARSSHKSSGGQSGGKRQRGWHRLVNATSSTSKRHFILTTGCSEPIRKLRPSSAQIARKYAEKESRVGDPTTLFVIDEADRLRMASLEQVRAIFDAQEIGLILIGMPGLEKRPARYAQFYSRIGFVHEFRPLGTPEIRQLLERQWGAGGCEAPADAVGLGHGCAHYPRHWRQHPAAEPLADSDPTDSRNQQPSGSHQSCGGSGAREPRDRTGLKVAKMVRFATSRGAALKHGSMDILLVLLC
jgi:AAA domain